MIKGSDNNWQCWTHDPDGNAVEFIHPTRTMKKLSNDRYYQGFPSVE